MKTKIIGGITMSTQIKITYTINAPRELLSTVNKSEHLMNWWGPKGWTFKVSKSEFRPAVSFTTAKDRLMNEMWVRFVYNETIDQKTFFTPVSFSYEGGNTVRAPFDVNWPMET